MLARKRDFCRPASASATFVSSSRDERERQLAGGERETLVERDLLRLLGIEQRCVIADAGVGDRADRADVKQEEHDARGIRDDVCLGRQRGIERGQHQQDEPQRDEPGPGLAPAVEEDGDERRQERRQNHSARVDEPAEKVVKRDRSEEDDERLLKPEPFEVAREEERDHAERSSAADRRPAPAPRAARRGCRYATARDGQTGAFARTTTSSSRFLRSASSSSPGVATNDTRRAHRRSRPGRSSSIVSVAFIQTSGSAKASPLSAAPAAANEIGEQTFTRPADDGAHQTACHTLRRLGDRRVRMMRRRSAHPPATFATATI